MNDNKDHVLEKGYRPTSRLNTMDPPRSGSAVPSVPQTQIPAGVTSEHFNPILKKSTD